MTEISKDTEKLYQTALPPQAANPHVTPYETISENYRTNRYNKWLDTGDDANSAQRRFGDDFFFVNSTPKFRLKKTDKFFAIGSCFARNIERALKTQGIAVLTEGTNIPAEFYTSDRDPRAAMNKFNIPSMIDEIERAFDPDRDETGRYIKVGEDQYFDPATTNINLHSLEKHAIVRKAIAETTRRIADADVVVITLGLVEAWFDRISGLYLNTSPHQRAMMQEIRRIRKEGASGAPNRFVHMRPNFEFLRDKMHQLIHVLQQHAPKAKIVVSVSPVPLQATMTSDDVVASSSLSKCLLRIVAEDARQSFDHVDYFPSYEMVMSSPRDVTWMDDQVHVEPGLVEKITGSFVEHWID